MARMTLKPGLKENKSFLLSAATDPNKDQFAKELVLIGNPAYFEVKVKELMMEATSLRIRIQRGQTNLLTDYLDKLKQAATALSYAAGLMVEQHKDSPLEGQSSNEANAAKGEPQA